MNFFKKLFTRKRKMSAENQEIYDILIKMRKYVKRHMDKKTFFLSYGGLCSLAVYLSDNKLTSNILRYIHNNVPNNVDVCVFRYYGYWWPSTRNWDKRLEWIEYHIKLLKNE